MSLKAQKNRAAVVEFRGWARTGISTISWAGIQFAVHRPRMGDGAQRDGQIR
jgi:hypothetical protein